MTDAVDRDDQPSTGLEVPAWLQPLAGAAAARRSAEPAAGAAGRGTGPHSAVLILFGEDANGPTVLITERAPTLRSHAGQPSFPGGRIGPGDDGPAAAALREAVEETGLDPTGVHVFGQLPDVVMSLNGAVVTPVLGWWHRPSPVRAVDQAEVASVHVVAIGDLVDPANRLRVSHPSGFVGPAFTVAGLLVWGFTAKLLTEVLRIGGFDRPWDTERVEPLPPDVVAITMRERAAAQAYDRDRERNEG